MTHTITLDDDEYRDVVRALHQEAKYEAESVNVPGQPAKYHLDRVIELRALLDRFLALPDRPDVIVDDGGGNSTTY